MIRSEGGTTHPSFPINLPPRTSAAVSLSGGGGERPRWHADEREHLARGGQDYADISRIPARYIQHIEIDDADPDVVGTLLEDNLDRRRLCGEGVLDVTAFLRAVQASGYSGPYGVEIISHEQRQRSLDVAAQLACSTSLAQFPPSR